MKSFLSLFLFSFFYGCITINPVIKTNAEKQPVIDSIPRLNVKTNYEGSSYDGAKSAVAQTFLPSVFHQPLSDFEITTVSNGGIPPVKRDLPDSKTLQNSKTSKSSEDLQKDIKTILTKGDKPSRNQSYIQSAAGNKIPFTYSYDVVPGKTSTNNNCETTTLNFNCTSSSFMNADYESQGQYIYPSAIYDVEDFQNGKFTEITKHRSPVTLSTDVPNLKGSSFLTISNPNIVTLREGIKELYSRFDESRSGNMDFKYRIVSSTNSAEHQLKLSTGGGGSFGPFSASFESTLNTDDKKSETYITVDIVKDLFSINSFSDSSYFDSKMNDDTSLMVMNSVTYGLRLLANIDITGFESKVQSTLSTKASASFVFSANGHLDLAYLDDIVGEKAKVNCYVVGGPINATCSFTLKEFEDNISKIVSGTTYNNARPIEYSFSDLNGNILAIQSAVTGITQRICSEKPKLISANVIFLTHKGNDADDKNAETEITVSLENSSKEVVAVLDKCCGGTKFNDRDETDGPFLLEIQSQNASRESLEHGAAVIRLESEQNDKDDWHMSFRILLKFSDGSTKEIGSGPKTFSIDGRTSRPYRVPF